jgi:GMP synthase-like glutamine amidotransferase
MVLLGAGKWCRNQIVRIAPQAYGIQSHFEVTREMLRQWGREDPDLQPLGEARLLHEYAEIEDDYRRTGMKIMQNFIGLATAA